MHCCEGSCFDTPPLRSHTRVNIWTCIFSAAASQLNSLFVWGLFLLQRRNLQKTACCRFCCFFNVFTYFFCLSMWATLSHATCCLFYGSNIQFTSLENEVKELATCVCVNHLRFFALIFVIKCTLFCECCLQNAKRTTKTIANALALNATSTYNFTLLVHTRSSQKKATQVTARMSASLRNCKFLQLNGLPHLPRHIDIIQISCLVLTSTFLSKPTILLT